MPTSTYYLSTIYCPFSGLLFICLLFKLGICQCIGRSLCKMCCVTCQSCWFVFENLWYKQINTKRVYRGRRRFRDVELGYNSTDHESYHHRQVGRKRKSLKERRNGRYYCHLARPSKRRSYSWRLRRSSRQIQLSKTRNLRLMRIFKRRQMLKCYNTDFP